MFGIITTITTVASFCLAAYRAPYELVYWHGPSLFGYGFWAGATPSDVCATYTGVPSKHWSSEQGSSTCELMCEKYFTAFFIAMHTMYVMGFISYTILRICCCRPIANYLVRLLRACRKNDECYLHHRRRSSSKYIEVTPSPEDSDSETPETPESPETPETPETPVPENSETLKNTDTSTLGDSSVFTVRSLVPSQHHVLKKSASHIPEPKIIRTPIQPRRRSRSFGEKHHPGVRFLDELKTKIVS